MLKKIKFALSEGILHNKKTLIAEPGKRIRRSLYSLICQSNIKIKKDGFEKSILLKVALCG